MPSELLAECYVTFSGNFLPLHLAPRISAHITYYIYGFKSLARVTIYELDEATIINIFNSCPSQNTETIFLSMQELIVVAVVSITLA